MKNIFINPTRKTLIALSVLLSMCICKSIVKPVYAEIKQKEDSNLIIYKEEDILENKLQNTLQNIENNMSNEENFEIPNQILTENIQNKDIKEEISNNEISTNSTVIVEEQNPWRLIIPSINLDAGIKEGTSPEILDLNIGHLETTSVFEGTIALCAHNRGYTQNYFSELKNLNIRFKC